MSIRVKYTHTKSPNGGFSVLGKGIRRMLENDDRFEVVETSPDMVLTYGMPDLVQNTHTDKPWIHYVVWESSRFPEDYVKIYKENTPDLILTASKYIRWVLDRDGIESSVWHHGIDDRFEYIDRRDDGVFTFYHYNAGEYRKGWEIVALAFTHEFHVDEPVGLVMKGRELGEMKFAMKQEEQVFDHPLIETIIGHVSDDKMVELSNVADCFVFPCFDEETKLVTPNGIIKYQDIEIGQKVFSFNAEGVMQEDTVLDKVVYDYDGDMVHFKNQKIEQMVTPNHRVYYKTPKDRNNYKVRQAGDFLNLKSRYYLPQAFKWIGKDEDYTDTTEYNNQFHTARLLPEKVKTEDLLYVIGWYISEGSHSSDGIVISNTDEKKLDRVKSILTEWGMKYTYKQDVNLTFYSKALDKLLIECGVGAKNKCIPKKYLEYSARLLKHLYDGMMLGDGTRGGNHVSYYTSSDKLKDDFLVLCTKLGFSAKARKRCQEGDSIEGRGLPYRENWMIDISEIQHEGTIKCNKHISSVPYKGKVWCIVTKNENMLVERNGRITGSGNCKGEGWGLPPCEMMATGVPAIIPKAHSLLEFFDEDDTIEVGLDGFLNSAPRYPGYLMHCSIADLRRKMRWAFENQGKCKEMGKMASERIKRDFNWRKIADDFYNLVKQVA